MSTSPRELLVLGTSHRVAPLEERERLAVPDGAEGATVRELLGVRGLDEVVVINTCNRVEFAIWTDDASAARERLRGAIAARAGADGAWLDRFTYDRTGRDAIEHVFRVAASLDSLVIGEPQILGQVKRAFAASSEAGGAGPRLTRLFQSAFRVAKRVRSETAVAENAVSISYAAVELARKVFDDLKGRRVLVIGAGKMGGLAIQHLIQAGADRIHLMNRTPARAHEMAARLGGTAHSLDELDTLLEEVDIVLSSTGSQHYVVRYDAVKRALSRRKYRPLFLIDIAVPRDIDPRCETLNSVYLFDVDDLEKVVEANLAARRAEAVKAEDIVRREAVDLVRWYQQAEVVPTIVQLREKLGSLRDAELEKLRRQHPNLPPEAYEAAERLAHSLINKVLHEPTISLRGAPENDPNGLLVAAVRSLFQLQDDTPEPPPLPSRKGTT